MATITSAQVTEIKEYSDYAKVFDYGIAAHGTVQEFDTEGNSTKPTNIQITQSPLDPMTNIRNTHGMYSQGDNYVTFHLWLKKPTFSGTWPNITCNYTYKMTLYYPTMLNETYGSLRLYVNDVLLKDYARRAIYFSGSTSSYKAKYCYIPQCSGTFSTSATMGNSKTFSETWTYKTYSDNNPSFYDEEQCTSTVTCTWTIPNSSFTFSASNKTSTSAEISAQNHTNPGGYWRYQAQWKRSTDTTWSSGSIFTSTSSTFARSLTDLLPSTTYNYRFAQLDRNGNIDHYSGTLTFTTLADPQATVQYNSSGTVKTAKVWYNDGGTIKKVKNIYYNNGGTIKNVKKV